MLGKRFNKPTPTKGDINKMYKRKSEAVSKRGSMSASLRHSPKKADPADRKMNESRFSGPPNSELMASVSTQANPTSTNTSANRRNQSTVKLLQNKAIEVSLSPEKGKKKTERKTYSSIYGQSSRRNPKKKLDETLEKAQTEISKERPKSASRSLSK